MPSSTLSLSPVSVGIYAALNVAALTGVISGKTVGIGDDIPQGASLDPFLFFEVSEGEQLGGLGTKPGSAGRLPEVLIRLSVFSQYGGMKEAQTVMAKAIQLLADPPTVSGYASWAIFWDDTQAIPDSMVAGVKVKELVANGRLYVEG